MEPARPPVSHAEFWDGLYAGGQDGWDLGEPAPALVDWLDAGGQFEAAPARTAAAKSAAWGSAEAISGPPQMKGLEEVDGRQPAPRNAAAPARIAVPGAGRGHDARLLARRGYRVTAFDFAEAAVAEARRLAAAEAVELAVEPRDVFTLPRDHAGAFDGVWEYTCFCAIDPARRDEYARVLHAILRPGGLLLACFFPLRDGTDGPPFPVSREEIERVLAGRFEPVAALDRARRRPRLQHRESGSCGPGGNIDRPRPA